jgi:hypothetical protein
VRDWKNFYFRGNGVEDMAQIGEEFGVFNKGEITPSTIEMYKGPAPELVEKLGIQMHWFSYYKKWIPQENYYCAIENTGFETNPDRSEGTYTKYSSLDDKLDGFHFWFGFLKFGMGRATRDASMEVRCQHITREEAVALVQRYDGEFPKKYFNLFLEYLDLPEERFWEITDRFRTPHLWNRVNGEWELRHKAFSI